MADSVRGTKVTRPSERLNVSGFNKLPEQPSGWPVEQLSELIAPEGPAVRRITQIFMVLDRSGSMDVIRSATLEGINAFIERAKESNEEARFTLATFSTDYSLVVDSLDLTAVRALSSRDYQPSGGTALLDAFARTIKLADDHVANGTVVPDDVLFVVMTDGEENSSQHYTRSGLARLIADRERHGYEFLYLGANQDSFDEAASMGVRHAADWDGTEYGAQLNMERASRIAAMKMSGTRLEHMDQSLIEATAEDAERVAKRTATKPKSH